MNYIDLELKIIEFYLKREKKIEVNVINMGGQHDGILISAFSDLADPKEDYSLMILWSLEGDQVLLDKYINLISKKANNGENLELDLDEIKLLKYLGFDV